MLSRIAISMGFLCAACLPAVANEAWYLSRQAAKILPQRLVTLSSPEAGEITIANLGEGRVASGTLLAVVNEAALSLAERQSEHDIAQHRLDVDKAILKLRKQREELEFVAGLPQKKRVFAEQQLEARVDERVIAVLDREIAMLEEKFRLFEESSRAMSEKKRKACTLRMPFEGRVQYHLPLPDREGETIPLPSSVPVVTLVDDAAFYIVIPATDPAWSKLEHERLRVKVDLGSGDYLEAVWHHSKVDKVDREEALFYYFLLPEKDKERAISLLGASIVSELYCMGEEDWLYVHKADAALKAGDTALETWEKLVDALYPGYRIVFIGETHICLRKSDECKDTAVPVSAS